MLKWKYRYQEAISYCEMNGHTITIEVTRKTFSSNFNGRVILFNRTLKSIQLEAKDLERATRECESHILDMLQRPVLELIHIR